MATKTKQDTEAASNLCEPANYNRISVDSFHINRMAEVIRAGAQLPPVVVDAQTLEIVDGVHRWKAYQIVGGKEAQIPVYRRNYTDFQTKFKESIEANAGHGRALTAADFRHCIQVSEEIGLDLEVTRVAMMVTPQKFAEYRQQFATTESGDRVPLTRSTLHLEGQIIPDRIADNVRHGGGSTVRHLARQMLKQLNGDIIEWSDEGTVLTLQELADALNRILAGKAA